MKRLLWVVLLAWCGVATAQPNSAAAVPGIYVNGKVQELRPAAQIYAPNNTGIITFGGAGNNTITRYGNVTCNTVTAAGGGTLTTCREKVCDKGGQCKDVVLSQSMQGSPGGIQCGGNVVVDGNTYKCNP